MYVHSQKAGNWHNSLHEIEQHLVAIENWWNCHKETGAMLQTGTAYMMLAYLNMLKGYLYALDHGENWKTFWGRMFRVKAEIIEEFGHANALWEQSRLTDE